MRRVVVCTSAGGPDVAQDWIGYSRPANESIRIEFSEPGTRGAGTRGASKAAQLRKTRRFDGQRQPDAVARGRLREVLTRHSE